MSTFGGACDVEWSCRNGRNVVINEDRWLGASESWLEAGAPLAAYRQMVLNHETGHWLGFGHGPCSGPGQPAPVMQQQSMTLAVLRPQPLAAARRAGHAGRPPGRPDRPGRRNRRPSGYHGPGRGRLPRPGSAGHAPAAPWKGAASAVRETEREPRP